MFILNYSILQKGDILLVRHDDRQSEVIRRLSNSDYSHAMLYVGVYSCIESDGLGVQSGNVQRMLFGSANDALVLRLSEEAPHEIIQQIETFARQKIGTEYSTSEARLATTGSGMDAREQNRQFCTRFVAQAYAEAGITIVANPDYCSPGEISHSPLLSIVENALVKASEEQIAFARQKETSLTKQTEIHNLILESARNLSGQDIQTFEQLSRYVIDHPENEESIIAVTKESGYLEYWKGDVEKNPQHYDAQKFMAYYGDQSREAGYELMSNEPDIRDRFIVTLDAMRYAYFRTGQQYFFMMIQLYKKLIELSRQRERAGRIAWKQRKKR
jgi:hypothetical protein